MPKNYAKYDLPIVDYHFKAYFMIYLMPPNLSKFIEHYILEEILFGAKLCPIMEPLKLKATNFSCSNERLGVFKSTLCHNRQKRVLLHIVML